MILYFSATGNSKYCADFLAHYLGDGTVSLNERMRKKDYSPLKSEKSLVLCVPTYAWRIPTVVNDLLLRTELTGCDSLYFVMTCGDEIGRAEKYNRELCEKINKKYMGTLEVKMPENYLAMFDVTTQEREEELLLQADKSLERAGALILASESLPAVKTGITAGLMSGIVNPLFYSLFVRDKKFTVDKDKCISCSLCAKSCPLGNLEIKEGLPRWSGSCTHCMACISCCPVEAIEYGKKSIGKRRYRCRKFEI